MANLQWIDTPDRLFQELIAETVRRTTNRVVLDPHQAALDPGLLVTGALQRFGYDAASGQVIVVYDASLSTAGGNRVETRRFTASAPADGTAASVGPALNHAANQVALEVAKWIGGFERLLRRGSSSLLEHVLRQAGRRDDPLERLPHHLGALGLEPPPAAERRHQPRRDLRIELVGRDDHVGEEGIAAPVAPSETPSDWRRTSPPASAADWGWSS